jgi:ubiquinone/menaquinone biosynthesis C-methylase UbiE
MTGGTGMNTRKGMKASIAVSLSLAGVLSLPAHPAYPGPPALSSQAKPRARLFPPLDLGLLEGADRDQWQKPEEIMDALKIAEGSVVADLGAGGGWFTVKLAHRVGPRGLVYAEDIQPLMIEAIKRKVQRENLTNVKTVLGTTKDSRLPHGLDAVLIVGAYHEMEDPVTLLEDAADSVKPQGLIGIVDFLPGAGGPGPEPDQRVDVETVVNGARAANLHVISRETIPPFMFIVVIRKGPSVRGHH